MRNDHGVAKLNVVHALSAASILVAIALTVALEANPMRSGVVADGGSVDRHAVLASYSDDIHAQQEVFNKGLPLKVDRYTTLQRVDYKKGYWNFHFVVGYYITKVKEFEDKKHASTLGSLCMDPSFVRSLKDSGPFLYEYLDPSGQTADVVIPRDDCGE